MIYPPPPGLTLLAYQFGSISKAEFEWCLKKWNEKHAREEDQMVDREKVIKGFECCHVMVHDLGPDKTSCGICPYKDIQTEEQIDLGGIECIAVLHDDALALLKEQEPVKPVVDIDTWKCGNCGHTLERQELLGDNVLFYEQYNFCPGCGMAVKWNDRHGENH